MKKILLASASLVAFAGVAAAEVTFGGSATLGYNDDVAGDYNGFYWTATVSATMEQELDNGLTAGTTFNFEIIEEDNDDSGTANGGLALDSDDIVVYLKSDAASLYFGDTKTAAGKLWASAGDMESDGFTSDAFDSNAADVASPVDAVLRGDVTYGSVEASVSYNIVTDGTEEVLDQLSIGAKGTFGAVTAVAAYEEASDVATADFGDYNANEIFGLSLATSFSGADFVLAYAEDENSESTGLKVTYPVGPVALTAYYVAEDAGNGDDNWGIKAAYTAGAASVTLDYQDDQGVQKVGIDATYDLGNGLTLLAGAYDQSNDTTAANNGTDTYIAAAYELGGNASLLVSYANAETGDALGDDEVGGPDYQVGTTVAVSFAF